MAQPTATTAAAATALQGLRKMLILGERDVRRCLDPQVCLDVNQRALISLTNRTGVVPTRLALSYPNNPLRMNDNVVRKDGTETATAQDFTLIKPAAYYPSGNDIDKNDNDIDVANVTIMGLKVVSVRSQNPSRGLPLVPATIMLVDAASGIVTATLAGTYITAMRTSAGPALAVRAFASGGATQELVVFGAGAQAECHIQLIELALLQDQRRLSKITIINRTLSNARALRDKLLQERGGTSEERGKGATMSNETVMIDSVALNDHNTVAAALSTADVISTTTNTTTPLWDGSGSFALKKGCLITSIGSYTPDMQEIPSSVVDQCQIIIDTPETMTVGDLKHLNTSAKEDEYIHLAGDAFSDPNRVRDAFDNSDKDYIFYKAVGTAIQDVLTAKAVVEKAQELSIGQKIDMS